MILEEGESAMAMIDILYETVDEVAGAKLVGVIGTDGLPVELILDDEYVSHNHETTEMELARLLVSASRTADHMDAGNVYDLIMETDSLTYLLSLVAGNYYAVLGITPDSDLGHARSMLHFMIERFQTEL